jgi:phosphatidylserine/phosphatidylglycerophosphate/cardiolipin synthase-like enzyme
MFTRRAVLFTLILILAIPSRDEPIPLRPVAYLPLVHQSLPVAPPLLISALYYDTYITGEPDEAFQLYNPLAWPVSLDGWRVSSGTRTVMFPPGLALAAHGKIWCARQATAFAASFGFSPRCEYGGDSDPMIPDLTGSALTLANTGGRIALSYPTGTYVDVLAYEAGDALAPGWHGPAVDPYRPTNSFSAEGQILARKRDEASGLPVPDTDTRADWQQDPDNVLHGRKAEYPGWDLDRFFVSPAAKEAATVRVIVSPDHAFAAIKPLLDSAQQSIRFAGYTFEHAGLGEAIAARARAGVQVEMLLEGAPSGGVTEQQRWIVSQIAAGGGRVYYLRSDAANDIRARYAYYHAKFMVLDGRLALISSENLSANSFPDDDKADGTYGHRGVTLVTDAPSVVAWVNAMLDADIAPTEHPDVWPWHPADPTLGAPSPGFVPSRVSGGTFYRVQAPAPLLASGTFAFQVIQSPEASLHKGDGLLALVNRAGPGDVLLVQALYEQTWWGAESSNVTDDPNPRLEAYIDAARSGATVRVLLDSYFDDRNLNSPRSNLRTVEYLTAVARAEGLDLEARRRNPTGQGIHNKMVLARVNGRGWAMVGSINGGEVSAKLNREVSLLVGSDEVYDYLARVFWYDWNSGP